MLHWYDMPIACMVNTLTGVVYVCFAKLSPEEEILNIDIEVDQHHDEEFWFLSKFDCACMLGCMFWMTLSESVLFARFRNCNLVETGKDLSFTGFDQINLSEFE